MHQPTFEDISPEMNEMGITTTFQEEATSAPAQDGVLGVTPSLTDWINFPDEPPAAPLDFLNSININPSANNTLRQDAVSLPSLCAQPKPQPLPPPPFMMGMSRLIQELEKAREEVKQRTSELAAVTAQLTQLRAEIQRDYKLTINIQKRGKKPKLKEGEVVTTECIGVHRLPSLFKNYNC